MIYFRSLNRVVQDSWAHLAIPGENQETKRAKARNCSISCGETRWTIHKVAGGLANVKAWCRARKTPENIQSDCLRFCKNPFPSVLILALRFCFRTGDQAVASAHRFTVLEQWAVPFFSVRRAQTYIAGQISVVEAAQPVVINSLHCKLIQVKYISFITANSGGVFSFLTDVSWVAIVWKFFLHINLCIEWIAERLVAWSPWLAIRSKQPNKTGLILDAPFQNKLTGLQSSYSTTNNLM